MTPTKFDFKEGEVFLIDKPVGWSSFDVVKKIRNAAKIKKVGHAGTLDPLASGLLIVCLGRKTKSITRIQDTDKEYTGTFVLGGVTDSHDLETPVQPKKDPSHITLEQIQEVAASFLGWIDQVPPVYSALKVQGKRAYKYARQGEEVKLDPRKVQVIAFDIVAWNPPEVQFRIACSKGTYIRSLARDLGEQLGVGAYLSSLRRTKVGEYDVQHAVEPIALAANIRQFVLENKENDQ